MPPVLDPIVNSNLQSPVLYYDHLSELTAVLVLDPQQRDPFGFL